MLTDRGKIIAVAGVLLWGGSRALGVDAFAMASTACFAIVALAVAYTRVSSAQLTARRAVRPARLFHDAQGRVDLDVRNDGRIRTATIIVEDQVPPALAETPRLLSQPVRPGETVRLSYDLHGRLRGHYRVGPAQILLRDPFGIAERSVQFGTTDEVIVYPPVLILPPSLPRSGRHGTSTSGRHRPPAPQGELATVREYVRGDDLRKVHWKTTAHRGKLMITQFESPREAQATIVLDARPSSAFEEAITAAASSAYHLDHRGYSLRLVTRPYLRVKEARGWRPILDELAALQAIDEAGDLRPLWGQLRTGVHGDGLLLTIIGVPSAEELRAMVTAGRGFGARAAVIFGTRRQLRSRSTQTAIAVLRASGWRVTTHDPDSRLDLSWEGLATRALPVGGVR
jgi:uncharacterized protein (DUF58 family)